MRLSCNSYLNTSCTAMLARDNNLPPFNQTLHWQALDLL